MKKFVCLVGLAVLFSGCGPSHVSHKIPSLNQKSKKVIKASELPSGCKVVGEAIGVDYIKSNEKHTDVDTLMQGAENDLKNRAVKMTNIARPIIKINNRNIICVGSNGKSFNCNYEEAKSGKFKVNSVECSGIVLNCN
ncbi:MAG: hypothetical protein J6M21_02700 [Campylobacter sp.]|nr:hypothetical protein [Campylobacter sp.]